MDGVTKALGHLLAAERKLASAQFQLTFADPSEPWQERLSAKAATLQCEMRLLRESVERLHTKRKKGAKQCR